MNKAKHGGRRRGGHPPDPTKPLLGFTTTDEFLAYVEQLPPAMHMAITQALWKHPDIMVAVVKELRWMATDQRIPASVRTKAQRVVKAHGWDDAALKSEDG